MNDSLTTALKQLRLSGLLQALDVRLQEAASHALSAAATCSVLAIGPLVSLASITSRSARLGSSALMRFSNSRPVAP